jgi:hypothetical protein
MIAWLNRAQNVSQLSFCDIKAGLCQTVIEQKLLSLEKKFMFKKYTGVCNF